MAASGALTLADYEAFGGIGGAIEAAVERAMTAADADARIPRERRGARSRCCAVASFRGSPASIPRQAARAGASRGSPISRRRPRR